MPNLTSVGITAGIPTSGTGTVSTIDNLIGAAGTAAAQVLSVQGIASGTAQAVTGPLTDTQLRATPVPVSGTVTATTTGLTDTQLRATPVPVSGTVTVTSTTANAGTNLNTSALALETGGNLAAVATATGAVSDAAVTDPTLSGTEIALLKGIISTLDTDAVTLGQATKANSVPVTMASDQEVATVTSQYAPVANLVSGAITSAMTGTTSTSLLAAPAGSLRNYVTSIIVSNSHATVGTDVILQDGSGGTTLMTIPAAPAYGGAVVYLNPPLVQPTVATALFCANVTTGSSTKVSAVGYTAL